MTAKKSPGQMIAAIVKAQAVIEKRSEIPKRDVERAYLVDCLEAARVATEWLWRHEEEIRAFVDERRARKAAE
jgi:hypothetical protein